MYAAARSRSPSYLVPRNSSLKEQPISNRIFHQNSTKTSSPPPISKKTERIGIHDMSSDFEDDQIKPSSSAASLQRFPTNSTDTPWFGGIGVAKIDGRSSRLSYSRNISVIPRSGDITSYRSCPPPQTEYALPVLDRRWTEFPRAHIIDLESFELRLRYTISESLRRPLMDYRHPDEMEGDSDDLQSDREESHERKRDRVKALPLKLLRKIKT